MLSVLSFLTSDRRAENFDDSDDWMEFTNYVGTTKMEDEVI